MKISTTKISTTMGGLLLALNTSVHANDVVPLRYVDSVDVEPTRVVLIAGDNTWRVLHSCQLFLQATSKINVRPAHKTPMLPHRMNRLGSWDSLVITVDDHKQVCSVEAIEKVSDSIALR